MRRDGLQVAQAHLRHIAPLPHNTGEVLRSYRRVVLPEMNLGQLALVLRGKFLVDIASFTQVRGLPFVPLQIREMIEGEMRKLHGPHSVRTGAQES